MASGSGTSFSIVTVRHWKSIASGDQRSLEGLPILVISVGHWSIVATVTFTIHGERGQLWWISMQHCRVVADGDVWTWNVIMILGFKCARLNATVTYRQRLFGTKYSVSLVCERSRWWEEELWNRLKWVNTILACNLHCQCHLEKLR
jgi:hypothetical protein